jgi:hypothetical protein
MNKLKDIFNSLSLSLSLLVLISILAPVKVHAVDITVGATTWYAWVGQHYTRNLIYSDYFYTKADPAFLYGPALSVKFNDDFNLTFIFLYGKFNIEEKTDVIISDRLEYEFSRIDSDLAINYKLNDYFKIFAGIKYMTFDSPGPDNAGGNGGAVERVERWVLGPGLGLSGTFPMTENLFIIGSFSGFYLWGKEFKDIFNQSGNRMPTKNTNCNDYGINLNLALAYYIAPISTTISLGGRFQFIKTNYPSNYIGDDFATNGIDRYYYDDKNKFYGITLAATYTFSI